MKAIKVPVFLYVFCLIFFGIDSSVYSDEHETGGNKIAVVRIEGAILDSVEAIKSIRKFAESKGVVALVLRINSPGGGVAPTQEIYSEILKQREAGMVVVTSMGSIAASGGYYLAAATDYIVANPGTITGSIGVIMVFPNVRGLFDKLGLDTQVVKSGKYKDMGSPARDLTDQERLVLKELIDDVFGQFIEAIEKGRGLSVEQIRQISDGGIYSGRQALELGLVDKLGSLDEAIDEAAKLAKIIGEPKVILERPQRGLLRMLLSGNFWRPIKEKLGDFYPRLEYRWRY
jgi:protease-4